MELRQVAKVELCLPVIVIIIIDASLRQPQGLAPVEPVKPNIFGLHNLSRESDDRGKNCNAPSMLIFDY
jgi:hypothetical protein